MATKPIGMGAVLGATSSGSVGKKKVTKRGGGMKMPVRPKRKIGPARAKRRARIDAGGKRPLKKIATNRKKARSYGIKPRRFP